MKMVWSLISTTFFYCEFPLPKGALGQVWLKLVPVVFEKILNMWKVHRQTDGQIRQTTDKLWSQ